MQLGIPIGQRLLELCVLRDKNSKREIKVNNMLGFIGNTLWKTLYGRGVSTIERAAASTQTDTSNPQLKPVITRCRFKLVCEFLLSHLSISHFEQT